MQINGTASQGKRVEPSGRLSSTVHSPLDFFVTGMSADTNVMALMSLMVAMVPFLLEACLQTNGS